MNVAAILERVGLVPTAPTSSEAVGTAPAVSVQRFPLVPTVPGKKCKDPAEPVKPSQLDRSESDEVRTLLRTLAERFGIDPAHVERIQLDELALWGVVVAESLPAYLQALEDNATRHAGLVPADDTAPILCAHCGPVWAHPSIAAVLPVVESWPRAAGCPWCFVRKTSGYLPRPPVKCEACISFQTSATNPAAGVGHCARGHGTPYPMQRHRCPDFQPSGATLSRLAPRTGC